MNFGCHYDEWKNPCAKNPSFIISYMWLYLVHHISRNGNWKNTAHFSGCIPAPHGNNVKLAKPLQYRRGEGARDICICAHTCHCPGDRARALTTGLHLSAVEPLRRSVHGSLLSVGSNFVLLMELLLLFTCFPLPSLLLLPKTPLEYKLHEEGTFLDPQQWGPAT